MDVASMDLAPRSFRSFAWAVGDYDAVNVSARSLPVSRQHLIDEPMRLVMAWGEPVEWGIETTQQMFDVTSFNDREPNVMGLRTTTLRAVFHLDSMPSDDSFMRESGVRFEHELRSYTGTLHVTDALVRPSVDGLFVLEVRGRLNAKAEDRETAAPVERRVAVPSNNARSMRLRAGSWED